LRGVIGNIKFDNNGNMIGAIEVYQYRGELKSGSGMSYVAVKVGQSDQYGTSVSSLNLSSLNWTSFRKDDSDTQQPQSSCGRPCKAGEYAAQLAIICCWQCEPCPEDGDVSRLLSLTVDYHCAFSKCSWRVNDLVCDELCYAY
jgi:hypothetical protein